MCPLLLAQKGKSRGDCSSSGGSHQTGGYSTGWEESHLLFAPGSSPSRGRAGETAQAAAGPTRPVGTRPDGKSLICPICPRLLTQQGESRGDGSSRCWSHQTGGYSTGWEESHQFSLPPAPHPAGGEPGRRLKPRRVPPDRWVLDRSRGWL
jgi:hypothetical protein